MKNKTMVMALIVSSVAFVGSSAFSAPNKMLTVQAGPALPMVGDLEDIADTGIYLGIQALHEVNPNHKCGLSLGYYSFGEDSKDGLDTEVSIISALGLFHHEIGGNTYGKPYIEGGLGLARTQVNIAASNATGPAVARGANEEDISPTFSLGAGFEMPLSNHAILGASIGYQHFFFKVGDVDGGGTLNLLAHLRM